ncbi:hypothetical protein yc1106_02932 [Curvularia clavata]|uniref:Uncharacterized protein n=1 Tax=Curvularia clavata TaxID=95742 RepID=A0A9Q8Z7E5_CURCL|nr:hypothetical protein yc1106_02932 [Curvularia clavata]
METNTSSSGPIRPNDEFRPNSEVQLSNSESLISQRQRRASLLISQHYEPLITEILSEELLKYTHSTAIDPTDVVRHKRDCALIIASASPIFTAAVTGNLVARMLTDPYLQNEYAALSAQAHHQPSIYAHFLTDKFGIAPTPTQYLTISNTITSYLSADQPSPHAWAIDNVTSPPVTLQSSSTGHRKYLQTRSSTRSSQRINTLSRFCAAARTRFVQTPAALHDTPFTFPPAECGYSYDSHTRIAQHRARRGSNYIMNLVEDTCAYLHQCGTFTQLFVMHPFIIFLLFRARQAVMAEILCSGLLQVWVDGGGGFNAWPAGRSVSSATRVRREDWRGFERCVVRGSEIVETLRAQKQRAEEWWRALDSEEVCVEEMEEDDDAEDGDM